MTKKKKQAEVTPPPEKTPPAAAGEAETSELETAPADEVERLQQELEQAQIQASEYLEGWQRAKAEFANYRRRQDIEWEQRAQMSSASLIVKILPVLDDLERALQTIPEAIQHLTWIEGIFLVKHKLETVLESEGVKAIETEGQSFDPLYHEAVTYEQAEGYEEDQIIGELQRGYMIAQRVLRPALVRVAQAPSPAEESQETEEQAD
ncbi:MAG: nucleotide exchange factor GrpE [Anaerolineae bacterium]|nr:nucleotide exchange factor GrpE [Anaerolineae bacterium]